MTSGTNLTLGEATRRVHDRITLEAVGKGSYGREHEANVSGNAGYDEVLAPSYLHGIDEALLVSPHPETRPRPMEERRDPPRHLSRPPAGVCGKRTSHRASAGRPQQHGRQIGLELAARELRLERKPPDPFAGRRSHRVGHRGGYARRAGLAEPTGCLGALDQVHVDLRTLVEAHDPVIG